MVHSGGCAFVHGGSGVAPWECVDGAVLVWDLAGLMGGQTERGGAMGMSASPVGTRYYLWE